MIHLYDLTWKIVTWLIEEQVQSLCNCLNQIVQTDLGYPAPHPRSLTLSLQIATTYLQKICPFKIADTSNIAKFFLTQKTCDIIHILQQIASLSDLIVTVI